MNNEQIRLLLESAIALELGVASLYRLFSELYEEDRAFWSQLQLEEKSHAALLRAALDSFEKRQLLPTGMMPTSLEHMEQFNMKVAVLLEQCRKTPPSRHNACELAIVLERDVGEEHFNQFMEKPPESMIEEVFQRLNRNDKDHAERITEYLGTIQS